MNGNWMKRVIALLAWGSLGIVNVAAQSPWPQVGIRPMFEPETWLVAYTFSEHPGPLPVRGIPEMLAAAGLELVSSREQSPYPEQRVWLTTRLKPGARFGDAYRVVRDFDFGTPRLTITGVQPNYTYFIWAPPHAARSFALSSRMEVGTGEAVAVGGVVVPGEFPRLAVIRVRGASLGQFGITRPLANPTLQLFEGTRQIAQNDDWGSLPKWERDQATARRLAPDDPAESLIVTYLDPGAYTAQVGGAGDSTGIALLEIHLEDNFLMMPASP